MTDPRFNIDFDWSTFHLLWWTGPDGNDIVRITAKGITMSINGKKRTFVPDGFAEAWDLYIKKAQGGTP